MSDGRAVPAVAIALSMVLLAGCIGTSPGQQAELDLGPEDPDVPRGPRHRPGQPCLTCHGEDHNPGGLLFAVAGTIYRQADDARGQGDVRVELEDAAGHRFTARTNPVGNFYVRVDTGLSEPRQGSDGQLRIPWEPRFPLRATVRHGDDEQTMRGLIWREGSCAACHAGPPSARSNGRVFVVAEEAP